MNYQTKPKTTHKQELQTETMQVPAVFHLSLELMPHEDTIAQIEHLAQDKRLFHHIAAMSDVHSKKGRKNPTGTVVATKNHFLPQINDTAPNCGMRLIKTNLNEQNATPEQIHALFEELVKVVPTKKYVGTPISYDLAMQICQKGIAPLINHFKTRTKNELENTFKQGNVFENKNVSEEEILNSIPKLFLHIGKYRLGILGAAGNHFLDLMKITDVKNNEIAQKFGLKEGQYVFLMHTGSGLLGQYASYMYTPKRKEHLSQRIVLELGTATFNSKHKEIYKKIAQDVAAHKDKAEYFGYEVGTIEGTMFHNAHLASANFGFANRTILTHHLDQALEKVFGKQIDLELLYDTSHISIEKETHFGEDVFVHRNGSVRAYGPSRMQNHPLFGQTGEPVFIPSSMGTPAYIGVGTDENESTFFSAPHGTGRRKIADADAAHSKAELFSHLEESRIRLYNAASKGVVLQDSRYYKDVEEVVAGLEENKIIKTVAKMQPVAVLMY